MIKRALTVFVLSAAVTGFVMLPDGAEARWERTTAQQCVAENGAGWRNPIGIANYGGGLGATGLFFFCPVRDDSQFPKSAIRGLNLHGHDDLNNDAITAKACVSYWNMWAGACGYWGTSGTSFVGEATIQPELSVWGASHAGDFGYLFVYLPPGGNSINGYFTWD